MRDLLSRLSRHGRPLRIRLTIAFGSVIAIVLAATGVLIYVQFARDFDARVDLDLKESQTAIVRLAAAGSQPEQLLARSGESLAQVYDASGTLLATTRLLREDRTVSIADIQRAQQRPLVYTHMSVEGTDDGARLRAFSIAGDRIAVIGEARDGREQALRRLATLLALTLPGALLLASLAGYQVARAALGPVEKMRAKAARIGAGDLSQRLPQPGTDDELDRLADTLNDLLDRLAEAVDRERRIVGDASHELRTPISVLRTRLDVALRGDDDPARLRAAMQEARGDSQRLSRLADDLLVLARADQGRLPLRPAPLDVQDLLEQAAHRHAAAAQASGRDLVIRNDIPGGAVVLGDSDRVAQALDNLLINALRYGDGDIELGARTGERGGVALSVRDHGDGYPAEFLPRAFERFSQADGSHGQTGSGLGLAIVQAIARAHDGTATACNHPDGGALSTLTLPLAGAADRLERVQAERPIELVTQVTHVDVDDVRAVFISRIPGALEKLQPSEDLVGVAHEDLQDVHLLHRKLDVRRRPPDAMRREIQGQVPDPQDVGIGRRAPPAQRAKPRQQLTEVKRLDQVVVSARVQPGDPVLNTVAGREHQDRRRDTIGAQPAARLEPVDARQIDVQADRVVRGRRRHPQRILTSDRDISEQAVAHQPLTDQLGQRHLVLHHQHAHATHGRTTHVRS